MKFAARSVRKSLHLARIERDGRNDQVIVASAREARDSGTRLEFGDQRVIKLRARNILEICVVVGARALHIFALEGADFFGCEFCEGAAKSVGADHERRAEGVRAGGILAANSGDRAILDNRHR